MSRPRVRQALAWGVHLYTGLGLVVAALAATLIIRGTPQAFRAAFVLLLVATLIDATDGTLARAVSIGETLPHVDGRRLDDIIDFHTYTSLPLLLIWRSEVLPPALAPVLLLPLLASAYGFSQVEAKTTDGYFKGFPSYWNVVAFYLYFLRPPLPVSAAVLVGLALLTFVPTRYLYPSQPGRLNRLAALLAVPWAGVLTVFLLSRQDPPRAWLIASLVFPAYYMVASWAVTLLELRHHAARRPAPTGR